MITYAITGYVLTRLLGRAVIYRWLATAMGALIVTFAVTAALASVTGHLTERELVAIFSFFARLQHT